MLFYHVGNLYLCGFLRNEVVPLHFPDVPPQCQCVDRLHLLEDNNRALKLKPGTFSQHRLQHKLLENELQDVLKEKKHLSHHLFNNSKKPVQNEQVKSEYEQLKETLGAVTQERDSALREKTQLQGKLENLEQVLKHMREAAERRQQLELEHEQALAVLNAKQQEIDLLQQAQVEAKKEHEGAVHLLENHLDSMQAKVRELEEKCRTQSEQFNLLSKELEKFRLQTGKFDTLGSGTDPLTVCESPGSPNKSLSQLFNGLAAPTGKGNESPLSRSVISEFIRPLQICGDKPELVSVKPTFLTRSSSRADSSQRALLTEMDKELTSTTRTKKRFTGKVRLCIARYSYNPCNGPNEHPEAELPLVAGKYLYVYGTMDDDGFYEGELLDGQQGLVPSNFVDFVKDEKMPSAQHRDGAKEPGYLSSNHSSLGSTGLGSMGLSSISSLLSDSKLDLGPSLDRNLERNLERNLGSNLSSTLGSTHGSTLGSHMGSTLGSTHGSTLGSHMGSTLGSTHGSTLGSHMGSTLGSTHGSTLGSHMGSTLGSTHGSSHGSTGLGSSLSSTLTSLGSSSLGMDFLGSMGSCSNGTGTLDVSIDEIGENIVPYPRRINLIKQLAKSVIVCWDPPVVPPGWGSISGYNVLVDKEVRMSVPFGGKTKSLIEKLNLATNTYRISVQSITERGPSDELRCTLLVGKDVVVAPYYLRVDNITQVSAELSWQPSNSNYSHTIFLNDVEYDMVKAGAYKYQFFQLKPMTVYKVKAVARTHQIPWQMPMEHRDKREISVEFCTQPAGPPFPPQEVQVQLGQNPGVLQVRWKPPILTPTGTSNGANVIGYAVCTKGQKIAEVMYPTADYVTVELNRIQCLEAREIIVRTLSAQGESQDSTVATIPHNILRPPHHSPHHRSPPHPHPMPQPQHHQPHTQTHPPYPQTYPPSHPQPQVHPLPRSQPHTLPHGQPLRHPLPHPQPQHQPYHVSKPNLVSARESETKEYEAGLRPGPPWERSPSPLPPTMRGHTLEPPHFQGRRSPSPQRILPQPQGAPIPNTIAKAMAREAAQRVFAENNRMEKRNIFSERNVNSDEEEDGYVSPHTRRRGASVDEFLRGSELGRHVRHHYSHSEEYQTESSRGSDLSDIMEEDEEDLYSEMQLEEGRRRSINSHNTLKAYYRRQDLGEERDCWDLQREVVRQKSLRSKRLHSIPEVAEDEPDGVDGMGHHHQRLRFDDEGRPGTPCMHRRSPRIYQQNPHQHNHLSPSKNHRRLLQRQHSSPRYGCNFEERSLNRPSRQTTKSPDSGLDCGSEEEGSLGYRGYPHGSPMRGPVHYIHCEGPVERRALAAGRKRQLTRQCSMDEDHCDSPKTGHLSDLRNREVHYGPGREWEREPGHSPRRYPRDGALSEGRLHQLDRPYQRDLRASYVNRLNRVSDQPPIIGNSPSHGCSHGDRLDHSGRRPVHSGNPPQRRPMMVPSIEITMMESNSEGSEGNLSPGKEDVYYHGSVARRRIWHDDDEYGGQDRGHGRGRRSPVYYEESGPEDLARIFVALFDYDPLSMSPNPDAADEELPFKEGQIIKVFGDKDTDGFYRAEIRDRPGLIPCNMVSEIQTEDDGMMDQLLKQGFLPLNTPVEKLVNCNRFKDGRSINRRSRKSKRERNRRSGRQHPSSTRRMVALYDYDPRESSPNVDVETQYGRDRLNEAELTFCAGDVITVFGEIDEDGFHYGELNGHKGLVPSNFLEEVPDDVEVFLTDTQSRDSRYPQDAAARIKTKRVPLEKSGLPRRAASPTVRQHIPGSGPATVGPGSPIRSPCDLSSKKKKGLLSKGKKLLKRLGAVK
ncbi:RIMS-binding protein 2 isoform X4 [Salvelinus fontinalis]|uniref:RIMS-binding protein 2 isoform X4 n=1 Tax=Salvelinus fontinalis TaxID=8038 RepID=UPI002485B683|nr:RIMS-binding protein 2 isoform X4 [Salvelinus fontinalis]